MRPHDVWFAGTAAVAITAALFTGTPTAAGQLFTGTPTAAGRLSTGTPTAAGKLFTGTPTATGPLFTGIPMATGQAAGSRIAQECTPPPLPGKVVDVDLTDTTGAAPMRLTVKPAKVTAGTVSLRASNTGTLAHEVVVLPLATGQPIGKQPVGADSRVTETASIGEASHNCGAGEGGGIAPGSTGWTTLTLQPGRYELICNFPGHYAAGMRAELDIAQ
jgi:uncharacterized cupredoxin-like copper-binding protein